MNPKNGIPPMVGNTENFQEGFSTFYVNDILLDESVALAGM